MSQSGSAIVNRVERRRGALAGEITAIAVPFSVRTCRLPVRATSWAMRANSGAVLMSVGIVSSATIVHSRDQNIAPTDSR
jgi:hypothetical protein